jgi:hypothetical protein
MNSQEAAILCVHVANGERTILKAVRTKPVTRGDSGWQFICGLESENPAEAKVWAVSEVLAIDPSIGEIISAPFGSAFVKRGNEWTKYEVGSVSS